MSQTPPETPDAHEAPATATRGLSRAGVALAAAGMGLSVAALIDDPGRAAMSAPLGVALLALGVIDARSRRLPDVGTLLIALAGLAVAGVAPFALVSLTEAAIGGLSGLLGAGLFAAGFRLARGRTGLGGGDVKLIGALGTWIGWTLLPQMLLWACLAGLAAALVARISGREASGAGIAFGPWLVAGFWIVWASADLSAPVR